jgi:hypothetical protein
MPVPATMLFTVPVPAVMVTSALFP